MIGQETLLVTSVRVVDRLPAPPPRAERGRGRPKTSPDRLFLKALERRKSSAPNRGARPSPACWRHRWPPDAGGQLP